MDQFAISDDEGVKQVQVPVDEAGSEVDPLDSFMNQLDTSSGFETSIPPLEVEDEEEETPEEMMDRIRRDTGKRSRVSDVNEYDDEDGKHAKRSIEGLPSIDHSNIVYPPFVKNLYREHAAITVLPSAEVSELRRSMGISVTGSQIPKCVCSFAHLNLPESIMSVIRFHEFTTPTPIQTQAIPCALSGRDVIGIAMTGSGKTLSYVIPAVVHVMSNEASGLPRVVVLCPTRELAIQIEQEMYRFARSSKDKFSSLALTGGLSKYEQFKQLSKGCDVVVGNPGRMIDLLQMKKGLDLAGVSLCVLDEADRMFTMGFEDQLRTVVQRIRPDRQLLMFSATMPPKIERLAREIMSDPIRVVVGAIGQAASVIEQNVFICHSEEEKFVWLSATIPALLKEGGRTLVFVNSKSVGDDLVRRIKGIVPVGVGAIHGDLDQSERMKVMNDFRAGRCIILVATDVAARGIDVQGVNCVIEYDAPKDFDTHTHRIGRTGRAGVAGTSWTLLRQNETRLAARIVESIEALGQAAVPEDLLNLAMQHAPFRDARTVHRAQAEETVDEVDTWEPLNEHFKRGRTESLGDS